MKKTRLLRILFFLLVGILIFVSIYRGLEFEKIRDALVSLEYGWIVLSAVLGLLSHYVRALRWNQLIEPLSHQPGRLNTYLAVLVLYLFNILIPRGGEFARCTVITRYEKISFTKLLGTVVSERLSDLTTFILIVLMLLVAEISFFRDLLTNNPRLTGGIVSSGGSEFIWIGGILVTVSIIVLVFRRKTGESKFVQIVVRIFNQFREGLQTILNVRNIGLYVFYSFLIIFLWLMMLYVVFFAYEPTSDLSLKAAIFTFTVSSFAFVLPIQAGLGAWHFVVIQCLLLFGIGEDQGSVFALLAHTFTNLIFLIAGIIAFVLLPVVNNRKAGDLRFQDLTGSEEDQKGTGAG
jgi:uncharacterized protein (TIRG00374 family)